MSLIHGIIEIGDIFSCEGFLFVDSGTRRPLFIEKSLQKNISNNTFFELLHEKYIFDCDISYTASGLGIVIIVKVPREGIPLSVYVPIVELDNPEKSREINYERIFFGEFTYIPNIYTPRNERNIRNIIEKGKCIENLISFMKEKKRCEKHRFFVPSRTELWREIYSDWNETTFLFMKIYGEDFLGILPERYIISYLKNIFKKVHFNPEKGIFEVSERWEPEGVAIFI